MRRPGSASASVVAICRASHSREPLTVVLRTSRASTGRHTGRSSIGRLTRIPPITQLLPYPTGLAPLADPSWNHPAAHTFFPVRENSVSSMTTVTAASDGTSSRTTSWASSTPSCSADQRAAEKNLCARSCDHDPDRPAPSSIPQTVRRPVWASIPQTSAQNVVKLGAVKHGRRSASSRASDGGKLSSGSIGVQFSVLVIWVRSADAPAISSPWVDLASRGVSWPRPEPIPTPSYKDRPAALPFSPDHQRHAPTGPQNGE